MSDYAGQPPHGGGQIAHHALCFGDCGHWDCLGCCGCPSDQSDIDTVAMLTEDGSREWLAEWFCGEVADARRDERERIVRIIRDYYRVAPLAAKSLLELIGAEHG